VVYHCAYWWTESSIEQQDIASDVSYFEWLCLTLLIIEVISVTFGQTAAGNSFNESYAGFQNDFVQPYLAWLKNVYSM